MLLRHSAVYILAKLLPSGLGFATAIALTWQLSPEGYGDYGLGMAIVMLGSNILFDWQTLSFRRWYESRGREPAFMPTILAMFAATCAISGAIFVAAAVAGLPGVTAGRALLLLLGMWAYAWFELASCAQLVRFRPGRYLAMNLLRNGLILGGTVAVAYLTASPAWVLGASFAAMGAAGLLYAGDGTLRVRGGVDRSVARACLVYGWPVGVGLVFSAMTTSFNRVMLGALADASAVGYFFAAQTLVQATIGTITAGLSSITLSVSVRTLESGGQAATIAELRRTYALVLGLLAPAGAAMWLIAPKLASLLLNPGYHAAVVETTPWLVVMALALGMRASYVDLSFHLAKRTGLVARVMGVAAVVNLALNALLIPWLSYLGAAIAMAAAHVTALVLAAALSRRAFPLPLPFGATARILSATALMAAAVAALAPLPGLPGLAAQCTAGAAVYGGACVALNVLGLRDALRQRLAARGLLRAAV